MQKLLKSIKIFQSYDHKCTAMFMNHNCMYLCYIRPCYCYFRCFEIYL